MFNSSLSKYQSYKIDTKVDNAVVTGFGGIFPYVDLLQLIEFPQLVQKAFPNAPAKGWHPLDYIMSLLLLNWTGGECVDDLEKLAEDPGIQVCLQQLRQSARLPKRAFARGGERAVPSRTCMRDWLAQFHHAAEETKRQPKVAFIPAPNAQLTALLHLTDQSLLAAYQLYARAGRPAITQATLEPDATYMASQKEAALFCYKKFEAYSALTVRWAETGFVVWHEFRDGNVPARLRNLEALRDSIQQVNALGITDVWVRSDSAACQNDLLEMLNTWTINGEATPVSFAIGYVKSTAFRHAVQAIPAEDWVPVYDKSGQVVHEVAEVVFVSTHEALTKQEPLRHIAVRRLTPQGVLPGFGVAEDVATADEETLEMAGKSYHIFAVVSNIAPTWTPDKIVAWYNERCGKGEEIHSILKSDLAGALLPSNQFGANAAWWALVVLAYNIHVLLQLLALPMDLQQSRFKRLRFQWINVPARCIRHAGACCIRYFHDAALKISQFIQSQLQVLSPQRT